MMTSMLEPGQIIGILGGGQLGRMLAQAAAQFGFHVIIYCPDEQPPAAEVADQHICAAYHDPDALLAFAQRCDCITYEFENIPVETVALLAQHKPVWPDARALNVAQDRLTEKQFIQGLGIPVAPFVAIDTREALASALAEMGGTGILKTRRLGYDGKGQWRLDAQSDLDQIFDDTQGQALILEGLIAFERELSVIIGRGIDGQIACYDPALNVHRNHILHTSTVPAPVSADDAAHIRDIGTKISSALEYVGVLAVELFMTSDGFMVNEIAPRVHNSGHWTLDACGTSQFAQHIRAISGWPLASPTRHSDARMTNLIGNDVDKWPTLIREPDHCLHLYGKSEVKAGRKMGHVTHIMPLGTIG